MFRVLLTLFVVAAGAAVALWQLDVVQLPFAEEAGVSGRSETSLFSVVKSGDVAQLQELLAAGSDVNARDQYGQTPLIYAISAGASEDLVRELLAAGADVNVSTEAGWTPLMYAARDAKSAGTVQLLMFAGADPTLRNAEGQTAADLARENPAVASTWLLDRLLYLAEHQFSRDWPSGYTVPVEGATISSRSSHLPGALRAYRNGTHQGFDFYDGTVSVDIEYGTPIMAVADGVVIRADLDYREMTLAEYDDIIATAKRNLSTPMEILDKLRGRQVWIRHPGGFVSRYAHLSAIEEGIRVGVEVDQGQLIAATGNSGTVEAARQTHDGAHPHVEIWQGDEAYLGYGLEACEIYPLAAQVFGAVALPPYTESCPAI
ncbi:MAG TPA: ankyrin repeat domain-containing protein [Trueperaceae bacterium]